MGDSTDPAQAQQTPDGLASAGDERLRSELADIEARISAVSTRLSLDYGSDGTREGWRDWLVQLRAKRDALRAELEPPPDGSA